MILLLGSKGYIGSQFKRELVNQNIPFTHLQETLWITQISTSSTI